MRVLIQRVSQADILINSETERRIGQGMLVLLGIEDADGREDAGWLIGKLSGLRIFADEENKMNLALDEVGGELMIVSQFTLHASTRKGNRPSYIRAARPEKAIPLYEYFVEECSKRFPSRVQTGEFGADMKINLINDGPVTIWIDSKNRE